MKLAIYKDTEVRLPVARLKAIFEAVTRGEGTRRQPGTVNLVMINDRRMRKLNRNYRNIDKSTDVLSFNMDSTDVQGEQVTGEIYIAVPTARRQAREFGTGPYGEYFRLFVHGLLHLLGYDHKTDKDLKKMEDLTEKYLREADRRLVR